jgi:8-oxo-dGTP diphosphatase
MREEIVVAAGVIEASDGTVLIARRPEDKHAGGFWEFPGGKVRDGESARAALDRELEEELGISVLKAAPLIGYRHTYPERDVVLRVFRVHRYVGEPSGLEGQPIRWVAAEELHNSNLLPADAPIIEALLLSRAAVRS